MRKIFLTFLILLSMNLVFGSTSRGKIMKEPIFSLKVQFSACTYKVLINDVPVLASDEGFPINSSLPVNQWLKKGTNIVAMELGPVKDAHKLAESKIDCKGVIELQVRENNTDTEKNVVVSKMSYTTVANQFPDRLIETEGSTSDGNYEIKNHKLRSEVNGQFINEKITIQSNKELLAKGVKITRKVSLPVNFPEWSWFNGDSIEKNNQTKAELVKQYESIWQALYSKDFTLMKELFGKRDKELNEAFYMKNKINTLKKLEQLDENKDLVLQPFYPKYAKLEVLGNQHLAKLVAWDEGPIIFFNYKDNSASSNFDITFMKKDGKWIIIR